MIRSPSCSSSSPICAGFGIHPGDQRGDELLVAALELLHLLAPLGFPDPLPDDMLCGLGGDAAELLGFELDVHDVPNLGVFDIAGSFLRQHLLVGILHLVHDRFAQGD